MDAKLVIVLVITLIAPILTNDQIEDIKSDLLRSSEKQEEIPFKPEIETENESIREKESDNREEERIPLIDTNNNDNYVNVKTETATTEVTDMTDSESYSTEVTVTATEPVSDNRDVFRMEEDAHSVNSNILDVKTEASSTIPTSSTPTTKQADDMEPIGSGISAFDDERDLSPRVPKLSDNSEPKQQDKRNFNDIKPQEKPEQEVSKSETLRGWLQDSFLRPPAGILVPLRPMALNRALAVWNDLMVDGLSLTDLVVVGYDSNGVNWRSRHNMQPSSNSNQDRTVAEALSKLILKYQDVNTESNSDGTMKALASAAKLVPYDSALFVVTDKEPGDAARLPLALRALVEKRLKVYTIWTDPRHPSNESERGLQSLRNISKHTEGGVLPYSLQVMDMESSSGSDMSQWESVEQPRKGRVHPTFEEEQMDTLLVRRGGGEAISLGVPVENGVTALRIYIEGLVEHAVLYPPNDAPQIDLYNMTSVRQFSPKSRTDGVSPRDVFLVFPGSDDKDMLTVLPVKPSSSESPAPTVGVWHLSVRCDTCDYRLIVTARTHVHFHVAPQPKNMLKIRVLGPVASVRESVLIDEYGTELAKLPFSYQPITSDGPEATVDRPTEVIADVQLPNVKGSRVYAKIVGRDIRGEPFTRLSGPINKEIRLTRSASIKFPDDDSDLEMAEEQNSVTYQRQQRPYNDSNVLPFGRAVSQVVNQQGALLTAVQIGLSSRLYGAPGDTLLLHFEVTNYREQSVNFVFEARGELRFLRDISPTRQTILSGQTANVVVTLVVTNSAQAGARDLITFTAYNNNGFEQVSISAYVYVTNPGQQVTDVWAPEIRHNFQGSCIGRLGNDCAQYAWSATVIARDAVGGLLRLSSTPMGLTYDSNFISGSREEVVAVYRSTCCAPRVVVTAVDAFGNANSYVLDISSHLTEAGIAAVVLGVFLFIAIIALVVFLIYWCVRRRKEASELPYTTSTRTRQSYEPTRS